MTLPDDSWEHTKGNTTTAGAVFHVLPWFSVFYNQSNTWNVPRLNSHNPDNSSLPGSIGEGHDYGIMLRLLDNRVSLRLNKYESTSGPDNSAFRDAILAPVIAIERTLNEAAQEGVISAYNAPPGYEPDPPNTFYYEVTSDRVSSGYEAELVANPTRNWRISLNARKAEATESNIGKVWLDFISMRLPYWAQHSTVQGPGEAVTTISSRVLDIIQSLNMMRQADGQSTEQGREWRANFLTRYTFNEGRMKGFFVGSGYRWRSKSVIGYRAVTVPNDFPFPGIGSDIIVPALNSPVYGKSLHDVEGFLGYSRRFKKGTWRMQLNVRNLFDDEDPIAQRANTSGDVTILTVPQPRTFILSTTFTY
jgi:outer membrane receptor for ferric coprogen and ferric-rhodotorulic acid